MKVKAIKTKKVVVKDDLFQILEEYLPDKIDDKSIIAVTSKIVSICEGRVVKRKAEDSERDEIAEREADLFLPRSESKYNYMIGVKNSIISGSAGVDLSNGNGNFVLWPKNPQESANKIREFLVDKYGVNNIGVVITDSRSTPLRWGAIGVALSHSGFNALKDYVGTPDLFGRVIQSEKANILDSLAVAATLEMGEGAEQKPIAVITEVENVEFQGRNPSKEELDFLKLTIETDFFSHILTKANWKKGGGGN